MGQGETTAPPGWPEDGYRVQIDGQDVPPEDLPLQTAWRTKEPVYDFQARFLGDDGRQFQLFMSAVPIFDAEGQVRRAIGVISDITDLVEREEEAALRERRSGYIAEIGRRSLSGANAADLIADAPARLAELLEVDFAKVLLRKPGEQNLELRSSFGFDVPLGTEVQGDDNSQAGVTLSEQEPIVVSHLDSERRFNGPPLLTDAGVVSGVSVVIGDVTDPLGVLGVHSRKARSFTEEEINLVQSVANLLAGAMRRDDADRQKLLLLDELRHRVKNMLATVQSVTSLSLRDAGIDKAATARILDRLRALASAHDLNFRREDAHVDLRELVEAQCAPYDMSRISISGGSHAELSPSLAIDTSILVHELMTNAIKHGALSGEDGAIQIRLSSERRPDGRAHVIEWCETGVTIESGAKQEPGTGTRLMDAVASQAAFEIERNFGDGTFSCRIIVST
jgi:two-component sensor histidine kinase